MNWVCRAIGSFELIFQYAKKWNTGSGVLRQKQPNNIKMWNLEQCDVIIHPCHDFNSGLVKPPLKLAWKNSYTRLVYMDAVTYVCPNRS